MLTLQREMQRRQTSMQEFKDKAARAQMFPSW